MIEIGSGKRGSPGETRAVCSRALDKEIRRPGNPGNSTKKVNQGRSNDFVMEIDSGTRDSPGSRKAVGASALGKGIGRPG